MSLYEVRKRDGTARIGLFRHGDQEISLPAVVDADDLFPSLRQQRFTNVPLGAGADFVRAYHIRGEGQPAAVHPAIENVVSSGDCVMVSNWHTALADPGKYVKWLIRLKEMIPPDTAWYAPASALPGTLCMLVYSGFDLFDFRAVDLRSVQGIFCTPLGEFPGEVMDEGLCGCEGCRQGDLRLHNRLAVQSEAALVRNYIRHSHLRELMESRCRADSSQVAVLRRLDTHYPYMERRLPVVRNVSMLANSAESLNRAEVRRFAERVTDRFAPSRTDVAVLLPCSAGKPYSRSQSHRKFIGTVAKRAHELIVTSPLGLVPRELEGVYPAAHYDVPVTGYWDREELAFASEVIARYFARHRYSRVIAHLDGGSLTAAEMAAEICGIDLEVTCRGHPASGESLRSLAAALEGEPGKQTDMVRGVISWQFNEVIATSGMYIRGRGERQAVMRGKVQVFSVDAGTGLLRPTFEGWKMLGRGYRVLIDDFIPQGDVLAPGVIDADCSIREGDEVYVCGRMAEATGRAVMGADEMLGSGRGVAVRLRKVKKL